MRTPWSEMVRAATMLGIAPEGFWRLSLKEWRLLTERSKDAAPMGRDDLVRMAEAWPDD